MTQHAGTDADPRPRSVLVVTARDAFAQCMSEVFPSDQRIRLTSQNTTFGAMNGHASDVAFNYDAVIFDVDPDDKAECKAIEDLLSHRAADTVFLALTDNDVSITKARALRDIGVDDVLPMSISSTVLRTVLDEKIDARAAPPLAPAGPGHRGQVITVAQARGGIGATTVAVNTACALVGKTSFFGKSEKKRVALLDLDLQFGNANVFLDLEDNGGFLQTIELAEPPDARFLEGVLQHHPGGVDVLCAPLPVAPLQSVRPELIAAILDQLRDSYDHIVVDLPRALVDWVEPVLKRTTRLVIVTDTAVPSVRQARRLIDFYREDNVALPVEVLVNREKRPLVKSEHVREAEKVLQTSLRHWLPDNARVARRAVDLGRPIVEMKPGSDLGKALARVADELATEPSPVAKHSV